MKGKLFKILAGVLAVALIAVGVVYIVRLNSKEANSVVEFQVNPEMQLIVNAGNKVIGVNYKNEDAEKLMIETQLVGKSVDEAAELFVSLSVEAGYIDVNTTGTTVHINVSGENIEKLQNRVINSMNKYFDENGIVAGAIANLKEGLKSAADSFEVSVNKYELMLKAQAVSFGEDLDALAQKTEKELLELVNTRTKELEGIAVSTLQGASARITALINSFSTMFNMEDTIARLKNEISDSELPDSAKKVLQGQLDTAVETYNNLKAQFEKQLKAILEELKTQSENVKTALKTQLNALKDAHKAELEARKEYVSQHKAAVEASIKAYRETLASAQA